MDDDLGTNSFVISNIYSFTLFIKYFSSEKELILKILRNQLLHHFWHQWQKSNFNLWSTFVIIIASVIGITKLKVENSFINYFDKETEIYKGMKKIDDELGGTTPLNIILKFPSNAQEKNEEDEFSDGRKIQKKMRRNQNIGLHG